MVRRAVRLGCSHSTLTVRFVQAAGPGVVRIELADQRAGGGGAAPASVLAWLGLDAGIADASAHLSRDPLLAPMVAQRPGLCVPGTVDGGELAMRTVLGQQVSVAAARTLTGRLVALLGHDCGSGLRLFPEPGAIAAAGVDVLRSIGLTGSRATTLAVLAHALAEGLDLTPGADRRASSHALGALRGIGPWTVSYVALRALRDPDAFPAHDLVLRQALGGVAAREALQRAETWRPWRGYAAQHLWRAAALGEPR